MSKEKMMSDWKQANLRQYLHNDNSGVVFSYEKDAVDQLVYRAITAELKVAELSANIARLVCDIDRVRGNERVLIDRLYDFESKLAGLDKQLPIAVKSCGAWDGLEMLETLPDGSSIYLHAKPKVDENNPPVEWQYKLDDGSWKSFENEKHRDDTMADGGYDIRPLYAEAAPVTHITITDKPMFQAAVSGLWYESPEACGKVIAVTFGAKHYKLPGIEQEAHCKRCGDVGEISAHVPMTMADFENVACPDCSNVENSGHIVGNIQEQANVIRSPNGWFEETISLYRSKNKSSLPTDIGDLNILANSGNADRLWRKFKDHEIAHIVNEVRDIAVEFGQAQQLRARIADVLVPALHSVAEPIEWESTTEAYKKYITDSQYKKLKPEFQKWYKPFSVLLASPADAKPKESVDWQYCPECGSDSIHYEEGNHKQCSNCYQEWFSDIDYSGVVKKHLAEWHLQQSPKPQRITEQDAREIAEAYNDYPHSFTSWLKAEGRTLLAKLNEHREPVTLEEEFIGASSELVHMLTDSVPWSDWCGFCESVRPTEFILNFKGKNIHCCEDCKNDFYGRLGAAIEPQVTANKAEVPEGWKLVPIDPDANMQAASASAIRFDTTLINKMWTANAVYRAAIESAPLPPLKDGAQ